MKIRRSKKEGGYVLLLTLALIVIVAFVLPYYLNMVVTQFRSVSYSYSWYNSIPMAEAGIEEGMTHLNANCIFDGSGYSADGWAGVANGVTKTRWVYDGSMMSNYYTVTIYTNNTNPEIVAVGGTRAPLSASLKTQSPTMVAALTAQPIFAQIGTYASNGTWTPSVSWPQNVGSVPTSGSYLRRQIHVVTQLQRMITKGLVAKGNINLNGNNVNTDSYDSSQPGVYSSLNGSYDATKTKDNGDVATDGTVLSVGNANVKGHVSTGPGGMPSVGSQGTVGDAAWVNGGNTGIQSGHASDDMNVNFPDAKLPNVHWDSNPLQNVYVALAVVTNSAGTNVTFSYPSYPSSLGGGTVTTNTSITTATGFPSSGSYLGTVSTNLGTVTSSTYPSAGSYTGTITTNTTLTTSTIYPSGTFLGTVATNTTSVTSSNAPAAGTYTGTVSVTSVTNYTTTNVTYLVSPGHTTPPTPGSYVGTVTTNTSVQNYQQNQPAAGTYVAGTLQACSQGNGNANKWCYTQITSYAYSVATSTNVTTGYTYNQIQNYTYSSVTGYSYSGVSSYSYARILSYTLTTGLTSVTNYVTNHYDYVFDTGYYQLQSLSGDILVRGTNSVVYIPNNGTLSMNSCTINTGAKIELYCDAPSVTISGNSGLNNNGLPGAFYYYGLPDNTSIKIAGNGAFTGVMYAPEASLSLKGGGNNNYDFVGAAVVNTVDMVGHFSFHYDEALSKNSPPLAYVVTQWSEEAPN